MILASAWNLELDSETAPQPERDDSGHASDKLVQNPEVTTSWSFKNQLIIIFGRR